MEIEIRIRDKIAILEISGKVLPGDREQFISRIERLLSETIRFVVLNLVRSEYISSAGLGMFIQAQKKLSHENGDMAVVYTVSKKIFGSPALRSIFHFFETEDEAVAFLEDKSK